MLSKHNTPVSREAQVRDNEALLLSDMSNSFVWDISIHSKIFEIPVWFKIFFGQSKKRGFYA